MNTAELIQEQREIWQSVFSIQHQRTEAEGELDALWQKVQQALAEAQEFLRQEGAEALWEQARLAPINPNADPYHEFTRAGQQALQAVANLLGLLQQPRVWKATRSWKAHKGVWLGAWFGLEKAVYLAFSPQGAVLASGESDKAVRIWDITTGRLLRTLSGHYRRWQRDAAGQVQCIDRPRCWVDHRRRGAG